MDKLKTIEKNTLALAGFALAVVLFISLNILASATLRNQRLDLTEGGLFTLSQGTKDILASLDEPITMRFYLSKQLTELSPTHANYAKRVREILEHYSALSDGMIKLEVYHPEPYSVQEDTAMSYGLQGVPVSAAGDKGYFGLAATNSTDDQRVIEFFDPEREPHLEYDLTKLVYALAHPKKPVIGLLSSLPMGADPERDFKPWPIQQQLKQFFEVRSLRATGNQIDDDVDVVMVVHPKRLTDGQIYALDQYVLRGGKAMVFVDPHFETGASGRDPMKGPPKEGETSSNLPRLFDAWGVEFTTDEVVADRAAAQEVNATMGGRSVVVDYLPWLALSAPNFNRKDVVTAEISRINMASAGYFRAQAGAETEFTPLITTTKESMILDVEDVNFIPDPQGLLDKFEPENRTYAVAARLRGPAKSAFGPDSTFAKLADSNVEAAEAKAGAEEDGDAAGEGGSKANAPKPYLSQSEKPINVIVVGDADMLVDRYWLQKQNYYGREVGVPVANNADFVVNALENLGGSEALISLRSRGLSYRPFYRVEELRRDAEARYRATEQNLMNKLQQTQNKLRELRQQGAPGEDSILTPEQQEEIENFRAEMLGIRQQLRDVQHALRKDIESLDAWLKAINIWAMPLLISVAAVVIVFVRRARNRQLMQKT